MQNSSEIVVGQLLKEKGLTLATAESCTGGLIADRITNVPGSSEYFRGGVVAYAYEAKVALLDVSWDTLRTCGAVSKETVIEMARGVRIALGADLASQSVGLPVPVAGCPISRLARPGSVFRRLMAIGRAGLSGMVTGWRTKPYPLMQRFNS